MTMENFKLQHWLASHATQFQLDLNSLTTASADASFRHYYRIKTHHADHTTFIVMDAPPAHEDCHPFIKIAELFQQAGLHAPKVLAQDLNQGFLLLTDLGQQTFLEKIKEAPESSKPLFHAAFDALIQWQLASCPDILPAYDEALLRRELNLFQDWYINKHLGIALDTSQTEVLNNIYRLLIDNALNQPCVYVHRDYMPRNLMISVPNPGILDFQDAVYGPITYDPVSLLRDAFISWEEEQELDWLAYYWEKAKKAQLPVRSDFSEFYQEFEWMGLQRHLKVLGIFSRIYYRDGKPHYLADTPRFIHYVRRVTQRYRLLSPLHYLLDQLENKTSKTTYSF